MVYRYYFLTRHRGTVPGQETPPEVPTFLSESLSEIRAVGPAPARAAEGLLRPNPPAKKAKQHERKTGHGDNETVRQKPSTNYRASIRAIEHASKRARKQASLQASGRAKQAGKPESERVERARKRPRSISSNQRSSER